jgi:hypothetical protein
MRNTILGIIFGAIVLLAFTVAGSAQTRIRFAKGRTSATVAGTIVGGAKRSYVLGAKQGQYLSGNVSSLNCCVKFTEGSTSVVFSSESVYNFI